MPDPLRDTVQHYLDGASSPGSLALLRPFQVAALLDEDALLRLMLQMHRRGDEPVFLRRLVRYAERRRPGLHRRYHSATAPLFDAATLGGKLPDAR